MKKLKIAPNTTMMNEEEFKAWLKDKICYHHNVHWIQKWIPHDVRKQGISLTNSLLRYIPYSNFFMEKKYVLKRDEYSGYSEECLGCYTKTRNGKKYEKFIYELPRWTVTRTQLKDGTPKFYVTYRRG